ncbi:GNAT family N-acetyltransferase [Prosthecomicrobium sp. N25]|uniref:GNAT family N-acetyltransferase n=1 Tax=Prosthecomicrobium sp. N25 TaxID=3129254 RepID=UPI0030768960
MTVAAVPVPPVPHEAVRLGSEHAEACVGLSAAAGWAHTAADWRCRLAVGIGHGVMADGRLVAAGIAFPAAPLCGWFGMLLVDPEHRGQGLGAAVTEAAALDLERLGLGVLALFAVPKAVPLYRRLGFRPIGTLASFQRAEAPAGPVGTFDGARLRRVQAGDCARLFALDRGAYGADRSAMLDDQIARFPELALVAEDAQGFAGYGLAARRGDLGVVGPVVARNAGAAVALVDGLARGLPRAVRLDSLMIEGTDRTLFHGALAARGFTLRTEIPLMVRGPWAGGPPFGDPSALYVAQSAAAG